MKQILDNLLALGRRRLAILAGVGLGGIAALLFGLSLVTTPDYGTLYSQLSPAGAASMEDALQKAGIASQLSPDGTTISVPRSDIARARMALAEKGLPSDGAQGWEIFDTKSVLGMDSFMQQIDRLRAMEGELARSIQTLDGVQSARVHLVLPDRQAFATTAPDPSASVIVRATPNQSITTRQAMAIRNLIAAAVPNMSPGRVTVLSARGDTILAPDSGAGADSVSLDGAKSSLEDRMSRNLEQILSARVGAGNVRVAVTVELDYARQQVVQQSFDPNQQVVRSTSTQDEKSLNNQQNAQVGVAANLPPAPTAGAGGQAGAGTTDSSNKTNESVSYEIGNTRSETTTEAGAIRRISVAVLVNGIYSHDPGGAAQYKDRTPEELSQLTTLVKSAIGFDQGRGDTVSVESLRFMDYSMDLGAPVGMSLTERLAANSVSILRWLIGLAVVALALVFGVRPVLNRVFDATPALPGAAPAAALSGPAPEPGRPEGRGEGRIEGPAPSAVVPSAMRTIPQRGAAHRAPAFRLNDSEPDGLFEAISTHGSSLRRRVDAVRDLVESDPNEAMKVLRGWLAHEAEAR